MPLGRARTRKAGSSCERSRRPGAAGRPRADWRLAHVPGALGYSVTRAHDMVNSSVDLRPAHLEKMAEAGQALTTIFESTES